MKNPHVNNHHEGYAINRTSVWTQVYGRTFSARFDQWPASWISTEKQVLNTCRLLFLLGLIPGIVFAVGFFSSVGYFFKGVLQRKFSSNWFTDLLMLLVFSSMIAMLMKLTYEHRDFCTMKAIYIWPGLMAMVYFLGKGMNAIMKKNAFFSMILVACCSLLIATSVYEIIQLMVFLPKV